MNPDPEPATLMVATPAASTRAARPLRQLFGLTSGARKVDVICGSTRSDRLTRFPGGNSPSSSNCSMATACPSSSVHPAVQYHDLDGATTDAQCAPVVVLPRFEAGKSPPRRISRQGSPPPKRKGALGSAGIVPPRIRHQRPAKNRGG